MDGVKPSMALVYGFTPASFFVDTAKAILNAIYCFS
jgi:hypothetical protein